MKRSLLLLIVLGIALVGTAPADPGAVIGGINWFCPAMGVLTGLSIATGQWIQAGSLAVAAVQSGCFS